MTKHCLGRSIFDQLFYTNIHDFYNLEQEIYNSFFFFHIPFVLFHMWVFRLKASYLLLWSSTHKRLRRKLNNLNFTTNVWNKFHLNWFCNLLKYHSTGSTPYIMWYCWIMNALSNTVLCRHLTIIFIFHPWYIFAIFWSMIAPILSSISLRRGHFTQLCRHKFFAFSNKRTCF